MSCFCVLQYKKTCVHPLSDVSSGVEVRRMKNLRFQFLTCDPSLVPHPASSTVAAIVGGVCAPQRVALVKGACRRGRVRRSS